MCELWCEIGLKFYAESSTLKIRSLVSLSDVELKSVLMANSKFWREIEKNFGHKRNRLGANAAREFEVYFIVNIIHLCEIASRLSFHEWGKSSYASPRRSRAYQALPETALNFFPTNLRHGWYVAVRGNFRARWAQGDNDTPLELCLQLQLFWLM